MKIFIAIAICFILCGCQDVRIQHTPDGAIIKTGALELNQEGKNGIKSYSYYRIREEVPIDNIEWIDAVVRDKGKINHDIK